MTPGQQQLVSLLEQYQYLSTSQFYDLLGITDHSEDNPAGRNVRYRLKRLATKQRGDGKPIVLRKFYCKGSDRRGMPIYEHIHYLDKREKRPGSLAHEKAITDVHLIIQPDWWKQTGFKLVRPVPDALFYKKPYYYFLEVQRQPNNFTNHKGVISKLQKYIQLKESGDFTAYHPTMKDFYVLVVVENGERRDNLKAKMKELGINYGMFKVVTMPELANLF